MKLNSVSFILFVALFLSLISCTNPNPFVEGQNWEGKYICDLEEYDLNIEITEVRNHVIKAVISETSKIYFGSFTVIGSFDKSSGQIEFKALDWIEDQKKRFRNAVMVDFTGYILDEPLRLEGQINSENEDCFGFKVQLVE